MNWSGGPAPGPAAPPAIPPGSGRPLEKGDLVFLTRVDLPQNSGAVAPRRRGLWITAMVVVRARLA
jgi:hypothetical protein